MFGKRARETEQLLTKMERQLDLVYTALLVRDPGTSLAADAYEGLRKQVVASSTARRQHVAQLAEIDVALRRGVSAEDLAMLVNQWLSQAGVERIEDPSIREVWETVLPASAAAEVDIPAYVDLHTGTIVRQGRLREKAELPTVEPVAEVSTVEATTTHSDDAPVVNDLDTESKEPQPADAGLDAVPAEGSSIPANDENPEER